MPEPLIDISRRNALTFAFFLVMYEFLTYMANDMIMPGMISVVHAFNAPESLVATSLTIYILGGASLQLLLGPLSDSYGRRPMMLIGAGLFFLFTILIAGSLSIEQFLIGRFFQGMGLCFIGVIGYATIQEIFDEMDAIRLIAIMANAAILAPLLGPVLGAVVIHFMSWRYIFIIIAGLALVVYVGLKQYMPEPIGKTLKNGQVIHKAPLSLKNSLNNYKLLLCNAPFTLSVIALGLIGVPCVAWIALAPIILIAKAQMSVIEYGLWQMPVFGATIMGNWVLHRLTHNYDLKTIVYIGASIACMGLTLVALVPLFLGEHYLNLMPGIIIYFFALSIVCGPLNRHCLFITNVGKGTASALMSLGGMLIGALGIEIANTFYDTRMNLHFGLFCSLIALLFVIVLIPIFKTEPSPNS